MPAIDKIRVLIADDHDLVREGLLRLVSGEDDMQIVAEAKNGHDAVAMAQTMHPAVVLLDMSMPGWDGVTTARALRQACPDTRIIALTRHTDPTFVDQMLQVGASGYVLKQSASTELTRAIRAVANGDRYLDPGVRTRREPKARPSPPPPSRGEGEAGSALTGDEERVLRLVAQSRSNSEIAMELAASIEAVAELKQRAMAKVRLGTRLDAIRYAEAQGWATRRT